MDRAIQYKLIDESSKGVGVILITPEQSACGGAGSEGHSVKVKLFSMSVKIRICLWTASLAIEDVALLSTSSNNRCCANAANACSFCEGSKGSQKSFLSAAETRSLSEIVFHNCKERAKHPLPGNAMKVHLLVFHNISSSSPSTSLGLSSVVVERRAWHRTSNMARLVASLGHV